MDGRPELLAPAYSAEGVSAAVQSGADAVYLSFSTGEKRAPYDLTEDELGRAAEFCRVRGVKVYVCLDFEPNDDAIPLALENGRRAARMGADALIAGDMGLIWALRRAIPSMPVHAAESLGIHDPDGVRLCAAMGVTRVAVARELSAERLREICESSPIEIEYPVHGPMCPAYAGTCKLASLAGAPAGPCQRQCLRDYPAGIKEKHPLAMRDLCLADRLGELAEMKVSALRIDGRDRRPEYAAAVTGVYSRALGTGRAPSEEDRELLRGAFPSDGFSEGYFSAGEFGDMLGAPGEEPRGDTPFDLAVRKNYLNHEFQRVKVTFEAELRLEKPFTLSVTDDRGNTVSASGASPELAFHTETTPAMLRTELFNTGGTPYSCDGVTCSIEKGIYLDPKEVGPVRDRLLRELTLRRTGFEPRAEEVSPELPAVPSPTEAPVLTVSVLKCAQLSDGLLALAPPVVYLPLEEAVSGDKRLEGFLDSRDISVCPRLPAVITSAQLGRVTELLLKARQLGITQVSVGDPGHIVYARKMGFEVRGDTALRVKNSGTLAVLLGLGLKSAALAEDLTSARVKSLKKYLDTELVVYGRMPLMSTAGCLIRARTGVCSCDSFLGFPDSSGFLCPVTRGFDCGNTLWSAEKLHLLRRAKEYMTAGLWGVRLAFTTENARECVGVCERYLDMGTFEPVSTTYGKF